MDQRKIILVTGATGAQGGSVARYLLEEGRFRVRCLTRNPLSEKALALYNAGAEIVAGDMDDLSSLSAAMKGVYGVFGVTAFWEHFDNEFQHGKNLIDAVVLNHVDFFIYSSLPPANKISNGRFSVPHFDIKADLQEYARSVKADTSFVHVSGYYENFIDYYLPQKAVDGNYYFYLPQGHTKYASVGIEDLGGVVRAMFNHPAFYKKRTVGVVGADMSCSDYAASMSRILGFPVLYTAVSQEMFAAFGFPGAEELANMFSFNRLHILNRQTDLIESYGLHPAMLTFEKWLIKNKDRFLKALAINEEKTELLLAK